MNLLSNLKLDVYFMALIYMSFILLVLSLFGPEIRAFSSEDISLFSLCWLGVGLFLWLMNDMLRIPAIVNAQSGHRDRRFWAS